jgi:hypothetical protein
MTAKKKTTRPRKAATKREAKPARQPLARDPRVPAPGKTIVREFKGKTYELKVTAEGYALGDVAFRTLTAAAKAVTKYKAILSTTVEIRGILTV